MTSLFRGVRWLNQQSAVSRSNQKDFNKIRKQFGASQDTSVFFVCQNIICNQEYFPSFSNIVPLVKYDSLLNPDDQELLYLKDYLIEQLFNDQADCSFQSNAFHMQ